MTFPVDDVTEHPAAVDLVAYADGELDAVAAADVRRHVEACARCAADVAELEPPVELDERGPSTFTLPVPVRELLGHAPLDDPTANEFWRVEWEGSALLVLVEDRHEDRVRAIPVTFEEPTSLVAAELSAEASPLGLPIYLWHRLARDLPLGAFLAPIATLEDEALPSPVTTAGHDPSTAMLLAGLLASLEHLEKASVVEPTTVVNAALLAELLQGFKPSELHKATGLELPTITGFRRGRLRPGFHEAELLAPVLGVRADQLLGRLPLPSALVHAIQRPVHRAAIRARAAVEHVEEAVARLNIAQAVAVMPARTSGGTRDVHAWDELVRQYLDE